MWQRIQTLYLGISTGLLVALLLGRLATVAGAGGASETINYLDKWQYAVLIILGLACTLVALVSFGHRAFQLRLAAVAAVVLLGLQVWLAVDYFSAGPAITFRWTILFPLACVVLNLLAIKGIWADELLVQSSSRLRASRNATNRKKK